MRSSRFDGSRVLIQVIDDTSPGIFRPKNDCRWTGASVIVPIIIYSIVLIVFADGSEIESVCS